MDPVKVQRHVKAMEPRGTGKVSEKCLLPLMAWFICCHIHCRDPDPKVRLSCFLRQTKQNDLQPGSRTMQEAANKLCLSLIKLRFKPRRSPINRSAGFHPPQFPSFSLCKSVRLMHSVFFPLLLHPLILLWADKGIAPFIDRSFHSVLLIKPLSTS